MQRTLKHFASSSFWEAYQQLPPPIQPIANKNFALLKENLEHPSLQLKKVNKFWSASLKIL
jgi:hypothetical protein